MAKAALVPKHYSINCAPEEMRELVLAVRSWVENYHTDETAEQLLHTLMGAYTEELGQPPGDPIDEGGSLVT